jgi:acyl-CoA thioesterase YciA
MRLALARNPRHQSGIRKKPGARAMSETTARAARRIESTNPRGELTVRTIAMPADTNANGDIFGGWVMAHMDQAGGIAGVERARGRVVTIAVEAMTFIRPMRVGDVLEVYTEVESVGRTSMKIHVEAWAQRFQTHDRDKVTDATFTFVHIADDGRARPIPPLAE